MELANNFLSDRLVVERRVLLGVQPAANADPGEPFPHAREELEALRGRLPRKFDWRERGAVTPVRSECLVHACWTVSDIVVMRVFARRSVVVLVVLGVRDGGCGGRRAVCADWPPRAAQ